MVFFDCALVFYDFVILLSIVRMIFVLCNRGKMGNILVELPKRNGIQNTVAAVFIVILLVLFLLSNGVLYTFEKVLFIWLIVASIVMLVINSMGKIQFRQLGFASAFHFVYKDDVESCHWKSEKIFVLNMRKLPRKVIIFIKSDESRQKINDYFNEKIKRGD